MTQQFERLDQRQIPPELGALPEDDADAPGQQAPLLPGHQPGHRHASAAWHQNAGEHFNGGTFAGTVWPNIADYFTGRDTEGDVIDGPHLSSSPGHQVAPSTSQPTMVL